MPFVHPVQWLRDHPRVADALLAALVGAVMLIAHVSGASSVDDPNQVDTAWWTVGLLLVATVPLAWRRTRPLEVGLVVVSAEVIALFFALAGAAFLPSMIAVYSIGAHTTGPRRTRVMSAIAGLVLALFVAGWIDGLALIDEFVATGVTLITGFVVGDNLRRRREQVAGLAERAERAEREQALLAEQRVTAERARIARELHDVVAHSVSVMVIQAAAARRTMATAPEDAEAALTTIESTGRQTMNELRGILGVLRVDADDGARRSPSPSLDQIDLLDDGDLPLTIDVDDDLDDVPDSTGRAAYRLVQESLTNVRRHAGPVSRVVVTIRRTASGLDVEVTDDGRGAAADATDPGYGIVGMRERVIALGGTLSAGPRPGGGWRVVASLPVTRPVDPTGRIGDRVVVP